MTIKMQDVENYVNEAELRPTVKIAVAALERLAQHGRESWEELAPLLKASEQWDEISSFLAEIVAEDEE